MNGTQHMFHTYAYATENFLCWAPSLHNVCVKATKNDARIFDFVEFMDRYSETIYPLFLWYAFSAYSATEAAFPLAEFSCRGAPGLPRHTQQRRRNHRLARAQHGQARTAAPPPLPHMIEPMKEFEQQLFLRRGVTPRTTYLYMHGHTLMDCVVLVALNAVCEKLRQMAVARINASRKEGVALRKRDGQLHQFAALDPRRAARQRELHLLSALQAARPRHRQSTSCARSWP